MEHDFGGNKDLVMVKAILDETLTANKVAQILSRRVNNSDKYSRITKKFYYESIH